MRFVLILLLLGGLTVALHAASPETAPAGASPATISFGATSVNVTGTVGGSVYVFSIAREPRGYRSAVISRERLLMDDDANGVVTWELNEPLPWRSIWIAVDLRSGTANALAPAPYPVTRVTLTSDDLTIDERGDLEVSYAGGLVEVILVRPSEGVWRNAFSYRGPRDSRSRNGKVTAKLDRLIPRVGTSASPPTKPRAGDVIILIDSFGRKYALHSIGARQ